MSSTAADVINAIPGIEQKRYLELGVGGGGTFKRVRAGSKQCVDFQTHAPDLRVDFPMTTDAFFNGDAAPAKFEKPWDVVFVDACHEIFSVVHDYSRSIRHLAPDGVVLLHDLVPPSREYTMPWFSGDGYKLLLRLNDGLESTFVVEAGDYGLTAVFAPVEVQLGRFEHATYEDLLLALPSIHPVPLPEMIETIREWFAESGCDRE